jgi:hypothetical protein
MTLTNLRVVEQREDERQIVLARLRVLRLKLEAEGMYVSANTCSLALDLIENRT